MKKNIKKITLSALALIIATMGALSLASCKNNNEQATPLDSTPSFGEETKNQQYPNGNFDYNNPSYQNPNNNNNQQNPPVQNETKTPVQNPPIENDKESNGLLFISNGNGTCTLTGPGNCNDACLVIPEKSPSGDIVTAVAERAFYGCSYINAIQIPSTVTKIGNMAFASCSSLVYISVSSSNSAYKDVSGVLYSSDGSTLILYPASKGGSSVSISRNVTTIADMAFYGCNSLRIISYGGTQAEWASIKVGQMNYTLYTASISCTDSGK